MRPAGIFGAWILIRRMARAMVVKRRHEMGVLVPWR